MKFWDASALLPLVVTEPSSAAIRSVWAADHNAVVWWGTIVECVSGVARAERAGILTFSGASQALSELQQLRREWQEIAPSERLRDLAQRLLRVHLLRAADALQLAAAVIAADETPRSLEFLSLDERLRAAAQRETFVVVEL